MYQEGGDEMFCHNCGTKLPEGAKFCINCGTRVWEPEKETEKTAAALAVVPDVSDSEKEAKEEYFSLRAPFEENTYFQILTASKDYSNSVENFEDFMKEFVPSMKKYWVHSMQMGLQMLLDHSVDYIDEDQIQEYVEDYINRNPFVKDVNQQLVEMQQFSARVAEETGSKDYWQGGGFGVSGAISGAVKAELLNVGTNALMSFGRFITGNSAGARIRRFQKKLMEEHDNYRNVQGIVRDVNSAVFTYCYQMLVDEGRVEEAEFEPDRTQKRFNNFLHQLKNRTHSYTDGEVERLLKGCIDSDPYNIGYYTAAYMFKVMTWDELWEDAERKGLLPRLLNDLRPVEEQKEQERRKELAKYTDDSDILQNAKFIAFGNEDLRSVFVTLRNHRRANQYMQEKMDGLTLFPEVDRQYGILMLKEGRKTGPGEISDEELDRAFEEWEEKQAEGDSLFGRKTDSGIALCAALRDGRSIPVILAGDQEEFAIPEEVENVTYIGVAGAEVKIASDRYIDWAQKNIHFVNLDCDEDYRELLEEQPGKWLRDGLAALSAQRNEEAFSCFGHAAFEGGSPEGMYRLGYCFLHGIGTEVNPGRAVKCLARAAGHHVAEAAMILGDSYAFGLNGLSPNLEWACYYYQIVADHGTDSPVPYFYLGMKALQSAKSKGEFMQAGWYLEEAAKRGSLDTALIVADWYSRSTLGDPNPAESKKYMDMAYSNALHFGHSADFGEGVVRAVLQHPEAAYSWAADLDAGKRKEVLKYLLDDLNLYYTKHQYRPPAPDYFRPRMYASVEAAVGDYQNEVRYCTSNIQNWLDIHSAPWEICLAPLKVIYGLSCGLLQAESGMQGGSQEEYQRLLDNIQQAVQRMNLYELVTDIEKRSMRYTDNSSGSPQYYVGDESVMENYRALRHQKLDRFAQEFSGIIFNFINPLYQALSAAAAKE